MSEKIKTPCIGVCSTGIGDNVCRGCKRFAHEVIGWNSYGERERGAIMERIELLLTQVVTTRLRVVAPEVLLAQLAHHQIRLPAHLNLPCQAYEAVRAFGAQLPNLSAIGCSAVNGWQHLSVVELKRSIDDGFYQLSCAHFERYFPGY